MKLTSNTETGISQGACPSTDTSLAPIALGPPLSSPATDIYIPLQCTVYNSKAVKKMHILETNIIK